MSAWSRIKPPVGAQVDWGDPISRGLVSRWLFNERAGVRLIDIAGIAPGAAGNAPAWSVGRTGPALQFTTASSQYVDLGASSPSALQPTGGFSIGVWFRRNGTIPTEQALFANWAVVGGNYHGVILTSEDNASGIANQIRLFFGNGTATFAGRPIYSAAIADSNWHFIVATWDGATSNMYVDGQIGATPVSVSGISWTSTVPRIGAIYEAGANKAYAQGWIDGVCFYNRALKPQEIARLYSEPFAGVYQPQKRVLYAVSSGVSIAPSKGALAFTGKTPTLAQTANQTTAPAKGALTFGGKTPVVTRTANQTVAPAKGVLAFSGKQPAVAQTANQTVTPAKGALTFSGKTPTVAQSVPGVLTPSKGVFRFTGGIPVLVQTSDPIVVPTLPGPRIGRNSVTGEVLTLTLDADGIPVLGTRRNGSTVGVRPVAGTHLARAVADDGAILFVI
jgi:hypothetical protein